MDGWRITDSGAKSWDGATHFGAGNRNLQHAYGKFFWDFYWDFCALGWVGVTGWPLTTEGSRSFIKRIFMFQLVQKVGGCREFDIKNVRLMHRMIFDNKNETCFLPWDFVQDFFRICWVDKWSFDQDDGMHIFCDIVAFRFSWHHYSFL